MIQAAEYRRYAEETARLSATAKTEQERRSLLQIAKMWEVLARHREGKAGRTSKDQPD